ncbi:serine/threonine-protein kinase LATS2 [Bubalus bubalis]|uniref:serine/threonine-protein kinase LATS2 n=1 Tax=Bubalus bubalis TaxID=89462 RepID=UPI001D12FED9|nr:serine/threonine-protein kinase LATS2 [Bubalus bubalis]
MRPKTFPATTYSGNSRQRLQEIREGLKQPPVGPGSDAALDTKVLGGKVLGGKDTARQQQMRSAPKFGPYQKALREIRYSLLPFANESGTSAATEVNRQMLQELVDAGCDQEMAGRALKQTGSRSIEAALEFISKMGYLEPGKEQIVRVVKQTSPGKGLAPAPGPRRPSFEAPGEPFPPFTQVAGPAFEGPATLEEAPRPYPDFLFAGVGPPCRPHQPKGYTAAGEAARMGLAGPGGTHYRAPLLVPAEPLGYGVQRSPSFQSKASPEAGAYAGLGAKGAAVPVPPPGLPFPAPGAAYAPTPHPKPPHQGHAGGPRGAAFAGDSAPPGLAAPARTGLGAERFEPGAPAWPGAGLARRDSLPKPGPSRTGSFSGAAAPPNAVTAVTAARILHPVRSVRVLRPEPQTAVGPSHPAWAPAPPPDGPEPAEELAGGAEARGRPPPYPRHLLRPQARAEPLDVDGLCAGLQQGLRGGRAAESPDGSPTSSGATKADRAGRDRKQIQTSPVPVRRGGRDEDRRESRIKSYSPSAFKFFMEQHVENVLKTHQQKVARRLQLEQEMAKAGLCEAEQEQMRKILYQKESNYNRLKRAKMDKSMFVKVKTLGVGAFGEVCLACKVDTHALYAMKTLRKKDVLNRNQVAHVKAERDILAEADNEWVVKLYYSFQDKDSLYFVMDYIPGGDMMSLLIRMEVFPEHLARFYIAELTLAVESVHRMGFIHRDIKPDNILIDLDGHIKLTDFGLCTGFRWTHNSKYYQKGSHSRQDSMEPSDLWDDVSNCRCGDRLKTLEQRARRQHQRCLAHSLVGTPNYIAPEVLLRKGYTQLCDWWSVGVILFEMLVGQPPFLAPTPTETQLKVINWESTLHIPAQVELSPEARDLIAKLCCAAEHRLGRNGADDLKAHPFLGAIDFSSDIRRQPAPYVPTISHPMDTSNFDPVDEEGPWQDGSEDSSKAWDALGPAGSRHPEHAFYEFTFRRFFDDNGHPFRCPKPAVAEAVTEAEQPASVGPALGAQAGGCQPVYV